MRISEIYKQPKAPAGQLKGKEKMPKAKGGRKDHPHGGRLVGEAAVLAPAIPYVAPMITPAVQFVLRLIGTTGAAWLANQALQAAQEQGLDLENDLVQELPSFGGINVQQTVDAAEIAAYLAKVDPGGGPPRRGGRRGKPRKKDSALDEIIEFLIGLFGYKLFRILALAGVTILGMYAIYRMAKWISSKFKSGKLEKDAEKQKESITNEMTSAGAVGAVAMPIGQMQRRTQKKKKKKA